MHHLAKMMAESFIEYMLEDDYQLTSYKLLGVGSGRAKSGARRRWKKKMYFQQDLLAKFKREMTVGEFKARFAGYTPHQLEWFFDTIKDALLLQRPKSTPWHARNKMLLFLDKLHNCLQGREMKDKYKIGVKTADSHIKDVLRAIITSYQDQNVVRFPNQQERQRMIRILKRKGSPMPDALFALDGSHARCTGRDKAERLSHKYHFLPCYNCLFVSERVLNTICAFSLDPRASKHDLTILREASFFQHIDEIMGTDIILADKGYVGVNYDSKSIAAVPKSDMEDHEWFSKTYWRAFNTARGECERIFAEFFYNRFTLLGRWPGKGQHSFTEWSANVTSCIILYNVLKFNAHLFHI